MRRYIYFAIILSIVLATLTGCGTRSPGQDKVLATVANKFITLDDFKNKFSRLPPYYQSMAERNKKNLLDDMIVESLFMEDAVRKGIDRDKEIKDILKEARKKVIIAKYVKTQVDDKINISDEEMKSFYDENKESFKKPAMWRASHILVTTEDQAKDVLNELSKGKNFEDLARAKSIDATATRGGDVGYFRKAQVVPEFEEACFKLKVGETSGIVKTQFGYHIIKLTDKKEESEQSFEEARPLIENELKMKKRVELLNKLVMDLKNKYHVSIEDDAMKALDMVTPQQKEKQGKNK